MKDDDSIDLNSESEDVQEIRKNTTGLDKPSWGNSYASKSLSQVSTTSNPKILFNQLKS